MQNQRQQQWVLIGFFITAMTLRNSVRASEVLTESDVAIPHWFGSFHQYRYSDSDHLPPKKKNYPKQLAILVRLGQSSW